MASQRTLDSFATSTLPLNPVAIPSGSEAFEFETRREMQRKRGSGSDEVQGPRDTSRFVQKHYDGVS